MPDKESAKASSTNEPPDIADEIDDEPVDASDDTDGGPPRRRRWRVPSGYGLASAVVGLVLVAAVVACAGLSWSHHRDVDDRDYQTRAKKTAAEWAYVLMNMNADDLDASLRHLRDDTAGQLNTGFDAAMQPYREMVQQMPSHSASQIESVVLQSMHNNLPDINGWPPTAPEPAPSPVGTRTDTIQVLAESLRGNPGTKPQSVYWNLLLDVSDVDGKLLISRLKAIR